MNMDEIQRRLLSRNLILFKNEITDETVKYFENALVQLYLKNSPEIFVFISSPGGDVDNGFCIYDLLKLYPAKKTAIVCGKACSMAAIILQAFDERFATPHTRILVHNSRHWIKLDTLRDNKKLKEEISDQEKLQKKMYEVVVKRSGKSLEEVKKQFAKNEYLDVNESIAFGLLDGIWDKPLPR